MSTEHITRALELAAERSAEELETALQARGKTTARYDHLMTKCFWIFMIPLYVGTWILLPYITPDVTHRTLDYVFCGVFMIIPVALVAVLFAAMIVSGVVEDEKAESEEALKIAIAVKKFAESRKPADPSA